MSGPFSSTKPFSSWSELTGIFGGNFNPPHLGHKTGSLGLLKQPGLKRVVILPNSKTPLRVGLQKNSWLDSAQKLEAIKILFESEIHSNQLLIDESELGNRNPSYTFNSLEWLRPKYGPIAFAIGIDQFTQFKNWFRFPEVLGLCHWIVLMRKPENKIENSRDTSRRSSGADRESVKEAISRAFSEGWLTRTLSDSEAGKTGGPNFETVHKTRLAFCETDAMAASSTEIRENFEKSGELDVNKLGSELLEYLKRLPFYDRGTNKCL